MLIAAPMWRARGSRPKKARAPSSPPSSPSVISTTTSLAGRPEAIKARTVSSAAATPVLSSAAPGEAGTVS